MILSSIGTNILSIIVFILCLSVVVCLHELGHLTAAKICNVYCHEFSIGFGPAIYKHKFKHKAKKNKFLKKNNENDKPLYSDDQQESEYEEGETTFAIRALPLGGYVAMASTDSVAESDANIIVPKERTLEGVNHFKQLCIMLAGIVMNFILAWLLFFCCFAFCTQQRTNNASNAVNVVEKIDDSETLVHKAGIQSGDTILYVSQEYTGLRNGSTLGSLVNETITFPKEQKELLSYISFKDGSNSGYVYNYSTDSIVYAVQDITYRHWIDSDNADKYYQDEFSEYKNYFADKDSKRVVKITYKSAKDGETKTVTLDTCSTYEVSENNRIHYVFNKIGIEPTIEKYKIGFAKAFSTATSTFNRYFVNIYVSLGSIFTPQGWKSVGGIISVYKVSASGFTSGSIGYFLTLWGFISLNLGCFNLLPFPGLDGWQTLIAIIEAISRKKIPSKVKNAANTIGLLVMLVLAGLLIIKDLVKPISVIRFLK